MQKITWPHGLILSNHQSLKIWEKNQRKGQNFSKEDLSKIELLPQTLRSSTSNKLQLKQVKVEQKGCFHQQSLSRIDTSSLISKVAVCPTDYLTNKIKPSHWVVKPIFVIQEKKCQNLKDIRISRQCLKHPKQMSLIYRKAMNYQKIPHSYYRI